MTASENIAFVRRAYDAIASNDIPWLLAHTADDVVFHQGGRFPTAGTFRGRDAMLGHMMEFMTLVQGRFSIELVDMLASDSRVAAVIRVTVGLDESGLTFDEVHLWRLDGELLREMHAIPFDPYEVDEFFAHAAPGHAGVTS